MTKKNLQAAAAAADCTDNATLATVAESYDRARTHEGSASTTSRRPRVLVGGRASRTPGRADSLPSLSPPPSVHDFV